MVMSPETFKMRHQDESYKELLAVREELLEEIREFEAEPEPPRPFLYPAPEAVYMYNLLYLSKLCELIADKYSEE